MAARVVRLDVSAVGGNERPEAKAGYRQAELPRLEAHHPGLLRFNPRFTFDRFVVGSGNQLAFAAAQAMASDAQLHTDALFIQSDPGLGKSHLSQAFSQHLLADDRRRRIYYLTAEDFTNELVYSLKNQSTEDFKNKYRRGCDVLVLEEIHFLSGKEKVQAELAYVLDILAENKKKVVFTGTRPPRDIPRLSRAFVSRLQSSLISSIDPPDYKTRMRILQMRAQEHGLAVDDQVFDFLAARLKRDIRQLESGLNGLMAKSQLLGRPLNLDLAQETLGDLVGPEDGCSAEAIQRMICRYFRLSVEDLKSKSRKKNIILPRNLGMYLCRQLTDLSLEAIGKWFGRNHSTVLYSVNLVESRQRRDPKLKAQVEFLVQQIKSGAKDF
jgi:chromosomal replication initiator protein